MTKIINKNRLIEMIADDETPDELLADYFDLDKEYSDSFEPLLMIHSEFVHDDHGEILNGSTAARGILGLMNKRSRRRRQKRFKRKLEAGFEGKIMVSEGDSWFQYPLFLTDVIDHLSAREDYAIYSLGYAGDWLSNILEEQEYLQPIDQYAPEVFLISGGGNDLVGKQRLEQILKPYGANRSVEDYFGDEFNAAMDQLAHLYHHLFSQLHTRFPQMNIIGHGYDYILPDNDKWLGAPMRNLGIEDHELQIQLARHLIDQFNEMKLRVAAEFDFVHHVDCRGIVNDWFDEIHPNSSNFAKVSRKFEQLIDQVSV